ncbi:MAG: FAD-dependent thymidylate synthase [Candidatus Bathyarchaeota archaeon]|nr:MAG: FAD-dependent thymidylate synthase [Candidatus Bathyarchaeota archaeon]
MPPEGEALRAELLSHTPLAKLRQALPESELTDTELLPHLSFTFAIEGISRACSHQLVRHRGGSFSQQSQRYVSVRRLGEKVIMPPLIKENAEELFTSHIEAASETYRRMVAEGVSKEDARFVLPNAAETHLLMTMDGRSLIHFFGLRCCNRAQWEIRALADEMLNEVKGMEPELFRRAGPYCFKLGHCPEGGFTCGRMKEVISSYSRLSIES